MIFQADFIGSIIGSAIATLFSIGAWASIEQIKKYFRKRKDNKNFKELFLIFSKKTLKPYMSSEIWILINEIGVEKILKVLKLTLEDFDAGIILANENFKISIAYKLRTNTIVIKDRSIQYNYKTPNTNDIVKEGFLKFFEERCKNEKIKLK